MSKVNPQINKFLSINPYEVKPLEYYTEGIINRQDEYILSQAITLLESDVPAHRHIAEELLIQCFEHKVPSKRIGITGPPGVGKSTFIERISKEFLTQGYHLAVLTIDPSSSSTFGSILGDKTRMNELSKDSRAFIRPSPSSGFLGGTNQHTFEAIILCEAAGKDLILVETVGVGQSELEVGNYVDFTILLVLPGSGDELQGIKKGIVEIADFIIVHKADGDRLKIAKQIGKDYQTAIHMSAKKDEWKVPVLLFSSLHSKDNEAILSSVGNYFDFSKRSHLFDTRRNHQNQLCFKNLIIQYIYEKVSKKVLNHSLVKKGLQEILLEQKSPFLKYQDLKDHIEFIFRIK